MKQLKLNLEPSTKPLPTKKPSNWKRWKVNHVLACGYERRVKK